MLSGKRLCWSIGWGFTCETMLSNVIFSLTWRLICLLGKLSKVYPPAHEPNGKPMDSQATWSTNGQLSISNHIYVRKLRAYLNPFQKRTSVFAFTSSSQVTLEKKVSLRGLLGVHWKVKLHRSAPPNLDSGAWDRAFFRPPVRRKSTVLDRFIDPWKGAEITWKSFNLLVLVCLGSSDFPGVSSCSLLNHPIFAVWCDHF